MLFRVLVIQLVKDPDASNYGITGQPRTLDKVYPLVSLWPVGAGIEVARVPQGQLGLL